MAELADPSDVHDYGITWVLAAGETLTASTWAVPVGITQTTPAPSFTAAGVTTIWLTGGTDGVDYDLVNHITTNQGRQRDQTLRIKVRNR